MPTWTDADLLKQSFNLIGRPDDAEANLSPAQPPLHAEIRFIRDYNITPPRDLPNRTTVQPYVWCCLCQEATHWIGWVAEYEQAGTTFRCLIGKDCATRKGGAALRRAAADYDARRRRADALRTRQLYLPLLPRVRDALDAWGSSPGVAAVTEWRASIQNLAEDFARSVNDAAKASPPVLLIEEEVRDHAAEASYSQRRGKDSAPIYKRQFKQVGIIEGGNLYSAPSPTLRIRRLVEKLDAAIALLQAPTDRLKTAEMEGNLREVREVCDGARDLEAAFAGHEKGLEPAAVSILVNWFNSLPKREWGATSVTQVDRQLTVNRSYGARTTAVIPQAAPISVPQLVEHLRNIGKKSADSSAGR